MAKTLIGKFIILNLTTFDYFKDENKNIKYFDELKDAERTAWMCELENVHILEIKNWYDEDENDRLNNS